MKLIYLSSILLLTSCSSLYQTQYQDYQGENYAIVKVSRSSSAWLTTLKKQGNCLKKEKGYLLHETSLFDIFKSDESLSKKVEGSPKTVLDKYNREYKIEADKYTVILTMNGVGDVLETAKFIPEKHHIYKIGHFSVDKDESYDETTKKVGRTWDIPYCD
ncbi:hypothetical protein QV01_07360 [Gallibacterium genomosp. 3]|uniref:Lipoprotein n=1 Tax=Gallibacterium genomosp. 3 TaxID=505345 RepID=A0A1A7NMX9_9PAST|nr:hypothetical protein [Gallibacterium genomosp. 3]OBW91507.1 hypothetical protein QV01_07360 [Gallibacterium genomosp. 3]